MTTVLLVIHLMAVLALIGLVLLQRSEGGALGIGGGGGNFLSSRGAGNVLTRSTAILAAVFFVTSIGLSLLARIESRPSDILDRLPAQTAPVTPTEGSSPAAPATGNGVLDALKQQSGSASPASPGATVPAGTAAPAPAVQAPVASPEAPAASAVPASPATTAPAEPSQDAPAAPVENAPAAPAAETAPATPPADAAPANSSPAEAVPASPATEPAPAAPAPDSAPAAPAQ